jgi:hypothetical protein
VDNPHQLFGSHAAARGFNPLAETNATCPALAPGEYARGDAMNMFIEQTGEGYAVAYKVWETYGAAKRHVATFPNRANAQLFCSSPDLLEALEMAIATIERLKPSGEIFDSTKGTKDVCRAAIAKAKGEK